MSQSNSIEMIQGMLKFQEYMIRPNIQFPPPPWPTTPSNLQILSMALHNICHCTIFANFCGASLHGTAVTSCVATGCGSGTRIPNELESQRQDKDAEHAAQQAAVGSTWDSISSYVYVIMWISLSATVILFNKCACALQI